MCKSSVSARFNASRLIIGVWLITLLFLFRPSIHGFDPVSYYSWLRSTVIQGDLEVADEFEHYGVFEKTRISSMTGHYLNEWAVGSALLWSPFFALGHVVAVAGEALGFDVTADGYSSPYIVCTAFGSAVYALLGLLMLYSLCQEFARRFEAQLAVLTAWLASPLIFYMSAHPFMSHANDFFVNVWYFRLWARDIKPTWRSRLVLGLVGGLAMCVRLQNATLLIWPMLGELLGNVRAPRAGLARTLGHLLAFGVGSAIGFAPQAIVWRIVFGQWIVLNPYGVTDAGHFDLLSPHFLDVLFSTNRGLFLWTPVALFALWGLAVHLPRFRPHWALFLGANFLLQVYVIGSWSQWAGAAAFGQRFLVNNVHTFALGLAALFMGRFFRRNRVLPAAFSALFVGWNLLLLARYGLEDIARVGAVPSDDLWIGQFTFLRELASKIVHLANAALSRAP